MHLLEELSVEANASTFSSKMDSSGEDEVLTLMATAMAADNIAVARTATLFFVMVINI